MGCIMEGLGENEGEEELRVLGGVEEEVPELVARQRVRGGEHDVVFCGLSRAQ